MFDQILVWHSLNTKMRIEKNFDRKEMSLHDKSTCKSYEKQGFKRQVLQAVPQFWQKEGANGT
jgi:hypothetical protein